VIATVRWHFGACQRGVWYAWPALRIEAYTGYPPQRRRTINATLAFLRWFAQVHIEI
jgi:hypothetical protein